MVAKISQGRTQRAAAPQAGKAPAKKPSATHSGSAQKAWQPSAAKKSHAGAGLSISKAVIDDGLPTTPKLTLPKGYSQVDGAMKFSESLPLADGRTAKLDVDWATLSVKGPGGKTVSLSPLVQKDLEDQKQWFREEFKDMKKEDLEFASFPEWSDERSFAGAGGAGHLVSVSESGSSYTGGAHPNSGTNVATFDLNTGKQVKLDDLLPKDQVDKLAANIHARLQTLKGPDDLEGTSWSGGGDVKSIRDTINDNFALVAGKNGKLNIEIAWESGIHALGPMAAHFTVPAPTDAAFKAKVGIE